jgi:hypothetical protein
MISFEISRKFFGYGKDSQGYCFERWLTVLFITIIHRRPLGIRGIVKNEDKK